MQPFKHPFFLICAALFVAHQISQKILLLKFPIIDSYLDTLLCMPILLSILLVERRLWWFKSPQYVIPPFEVGIIVLFLSFIFEVGFPTWSSHFTGDVFDVAAYIVGGLCFHFTVNKPLSVV
ncbi:MAG: hypothetical protein DHS20C18_33870 [Saprospiraceae bacterium]|nr:MAG: hypothetical protein DHS20C18_33870 [Saprospiraceae bacterium]